MRRAGTRWESGSGCGPSAASRGSAAVLAGHDSNEVARFDALIPPSETPPDSRWLRPNKRNRQTDFLELPRPHHAVRSAKMALEGASVNLWKTPEVS